MVPLDLTFKLKIVTKLRDRFLKLEGVISWIGIADIQWESDTTLAPLHFVVLGLMPSYNPWI